MLMSAFLKDIFQQKFKVYILAVYILVQLEEYFLIWKAKPLTIQTDKGKW